MTFKPRSACYLTVGMIIADESDDKLRTVKSVTSDDEHLIYEILCTDGTLITSHRAATFYTQVGDSNE